MSGIETLRWMYVATLDFNKLTGFGIWSASLYNYDVGGAFRFSSAECDGCVSSREL